MFIRIESTAWKRILLWTYIKHLIPGFSLLKHLRNRRVQIQKEAVWISDDFRFGEPRGLRGQNKSGWGPGSATLQRDPHCHGPLVHPEYPAVGSVIKMECLVTDRVGPWLPQNPWYHLFPNFTIFNLFFRFCNYQIFTFTFIFINKKQVSLVVVIQSLSRVQLFATPWAAEHQASLSFAISQNLLKLMPIESAIPSNHLILCCLLLLLPSIFPSTRVFSQESVLHIRWPKYWSFSISLSNEYSGLISFRIDWFRIDLLAIQGTLKSFLQSLGHTHIHKVLSSTTVQKPWIY